MFYHWFQHEKLGRWGNMADSWAGGGKVCKWMVRVFAWPSDLNITYISLGHPRHEVPMNPATQSLLEQSVLMPMWVTTRILIKCWRLTWFVASRRQLQRNKTTSATSVWIASTYAICEGSDRVVWGTLPCFVSTTLPASPFLAVNAETGRLSSNMLQRLKAPSVSSTLVQKPVLSTGMPGGSVRHSRSASWRYWGSAHKQGELSLGGIWTIVDPWLDGESIQARFGWDSWVSLHSFL